MLRRSGLIHRSFRGALAVPAAIALALPLFAATEVAARPVAYAGSSETSCTPGSSSGGASAGSGGSREAVARRAAARWFPTGQVEIATAVAAAESSFNPTAVNKAAGGNYGLWQINSVHSGLLRGRNWRDPETNAWMAYQVWDAADGKKGNNKGSWTPWSVFNSGSYLRYVRSSVTPGATGGSDCVTGGAADVRVGTWNALRTNSRANIAAGTRELTQSVDVFGLQELGNSSKRAAAAQGADGFTMTTDRTAVPLFYRTDKYNLLGQGRQLAFESGQRVERSGSDNSTVSSNKWVTWVHLQDVATLQDFYVLNTHLLVGAENSAKVRAANERRVALYNKQLATVTTLVDRFRGQGSAVYVTCDCNVDYRAKAAPVATMGAHGLTASWEILGSDATHGKRTIDYVWSNVAPTSQTVGAHHGSDHASVAVTYLPESLTKVVGSASQQVASVRTVTDPQSGRTFQVPIPKGKNGKAIGFALDQVGDQWKFGSHGPDAWDCSALTSAAWRAAGIKVVAQSDAQKRSVRHVSLAKAHPGDILWRKGYVSIYLGKVGNEHLVVGSLKASGAVVIHTMADDTIKSVLRPTS